MAGRFKGSLFIQLRRFIEDTHGKDVLDAVDASLSEEDRAIFSGFVLVGGWYPVGAWNRTLRAWLDRVAPAELERQRLMQELASVTAKEDLTTIFKVLLRSATPSLVAARMPMLYERYFDAGTMSAVEQDDRYWEVTLEAPVGEDEAPNEITCKYGITFWFARAVEITGVEPQVTHTSCRFDGSRCVYALRW